MEVLIVSQYFWPEFFIVNSLALELKNKGHKVTVLTSLPNYPKGEYFQGYSFWKGPWKEEYNGIQVLRIPQTARKKGFFFLSLNYLSFVLFGFLFAPFMVRRRVDVIFCFAPSPITSCLPANFLRWICKAPLVLWVQDLWPESVSAVGAIKSSRVLKFIGKVVKNIYQRCDAILIQSQAFKQSIQDWEVPSEKIHYVPNWSQSIEISKTKNFPSWLEHIPSGFKVVFAGNIGKAQSVRTIICAAEILKEHQEIQWLIVGDGSEKENAEQEVQTKNLQRTVHFYGRRPNEDMPALLSVGNLMLVTLTDEHIFSLTVPQKVQFYMSGGRPIVAALNGEGARIVNDAQCGLTCAAMDAKGLADAVLKFYLMSNEEREQLGRNGFNYFKENFEQSIVVNQIENIFFNLVKK